MHPFSNVEELQGFARDFLTERTNSLMKDAEVCTQGSAIFPAILYIFSTIDLLGSLFKGDARDKPDSNQNSEDYMNEFMGYSSDDCRFLRCIFRNKVTHYAGPKRAFANHDGKVISWEYVHYDPQRHLELSKVDGAKLSPPVPSKLKEISVNCKFVISVRRFVDDVVDSVHRKGGYLDRLLSDDGLQKNFCRVIEKIYKP